MASGGPLKDQDLRDQAVSVAAGKFKAESEARADANWNARPAGATTPYTLKGHFT